MKFKGKLPSIFCAVLVFLASLPFSALGESVTYPAPPGETLSADYTVQVDGKPVPVYNAQTQFHERKYSLAYFDFSGSVTVRVTTNYTLANLKILPAKFGIIPVVSGNSATFTTDKPFNISFEPRGENSPLHLFGNPLEVNPPKQGDPGVIYFGPGIHTPNLITLAAGQTLYIAGGAVVKAGVRATGAGIRIKGRGILDGTGWGHRLGPLDYLLDILRCQNLEIHDIILRGSYHWTCVIQASDQVLISNLKICGSRVGNDDGINPVNSDGVTIRNSFVHTDDDCIAIKGKGYGNKNCQNITVTGTTFWVDRANVFRIGFESDADTMQNITMRDNDVIHYMGDREPSMVWVRTIFYLQPADEMVMRNFLFEDFRINGEGQNNLIKITPVAKDWGPLAGHFGKVDNVVFRNIHMTGTRQSRWGSVYLAGRDTAHNVQNITFDNVTRYGQLLTRASPEVTIGSFTANITFTQSTPTGKHPRLMPLKPGAPAILVWTGRTLVLHAGSNQGKSRFLDFRGRVDSYPVPAEQGLGGQGGSGSVQP